MLICMQIADYDECWKVDLVVDLRCYFMIILMRRKDTPSREHLSMHNSRLVYYDFGFGSLIYLLPITVAAWSTAWTAFSRSNTEVVGSNPSRGMNVCVFVLSCVLVDAVWRAYPPSKESYRLCVGRGNNKSNQVLTRGCSTIIQFNSIRVSLRASLTAQRPITELARVKEGKQEII
jgi:hypothetical protein